MSTPQAATVADAQELAEVPGISADLLTLAEVRAEDVSCSAWKPPVSRHPATRKYCVGRKEADRHAMGSDELLAQIGAAAAAGDRNGVLALAKALAATAGERPDQTLLTLAEVAQELRISTPALRRLEQNVTNHPTSNAPLVGAEIVSRPTGQSSTR